MAKNRKLGRNSSHRKAMLRNLVTSLLREASSLGFIKIHEDQKSGTVVVDGFRE